MMKSFNLNKFFALSLMLLLAWGIQAQTTISGTVTDEDGTPLIGASILVQGTTTGTVSELDGSFTLRTTESIPFKIEVSYTGFSTEMIDISGNTSSLSIVLAEGVTIGGDIVISASRKREKVQEAPASVSVLTARKLETSAQATDPVRNLGNLAGVQIAQSSASRINISMRGGAGLFGTSVFPILDYRSLIGPGIGTFQSDQAGLSQIDLERIEVVRGPGSALYGPGVTQGVIHFISKSPIDHPGTAVEVIAGELATIGVTARHATKISDKFGFKVNAYYKQGNEFTLDPNDEDDAEQIAKFQTTIVQPFVNEDGYVDVTGPPTTLLTIDDLDPDGDGNPIQEDWFSTAVNATLEFRPQDNLNVNVSGGYNAASAIFHNEQGEGLAQNNEYWGQARMQWGGLFAQVFGVINDGGTQDNPTFLYQTGNRTPIGRTQLEGQVQYNFDTPSLLNANWTAGVDYRFAGQDTENLVYGRNEDDDNFSVIGGYVQGKFELASKLDLVLAGRYDRFNFIDDGAFAPRAALVYKMNPKHTFRASFNRANNTVSNLQLNIDFPLSTLVGGQFDVWLYGNKTTQTFTDPRISWFLPALYDDDAIGVAGLPLDVTHTVVGATVQAEILAGIGMDPDLAPLLPIFEAALNATNGDLLGTTGTLSGGFNIFDGTPLGLTDAPISKIETFDNLEIGYKGLIADKLGISLDVYHVTQKNNSQFTAISPAYLLIGTDALPTDYGAAVAAQVAPNLEAGLKNAGLQQGQIDAIMAGVMPLIQGGYTEGGDIFYNTSNPDLGGFSLSQLIGALPFHATSPTAEVPGTGGNHLAAGYRTFDERSYWGMDLGLEYYFTSDISGFFNYSWLSDNQFMQHVVGFEDQPKLPSYLNNPDNKFRLGVNYNPELGFNGSVSFQHDAPYVASAGQFSTDDPTTPDVIEKTDARNLVDVAVGYKFDFGLTVGVAVTNALNNEFRYLPNMPKIGRRAIAKLTYTFGK